MLLIVLGGTIKSEGWIGWAWEVSGMGGHNVKFPKNLYKLCLKEKNKASEAG